MMISPAQRQMPVLEGKSNFLSGIFQRWLNTIQKRLNNAIVADDNGNIAYGGATIPEILDPDFLYMFTDTYAKWIHKTSGIEVTGVGCYWDGSTNRSLLIGAVSTRALTGSFFVVNGRTSTSIGQDLGNDASLPPWAPIL